MKNINDDYDVIVIGAGPAGYIASIRCAQLGLRTACIDDWKNKDGNPTLGGTYLNAGCIPSISLLESAKLYRMLQGDIAKRGIKVSGVELDLPTMIRHKDQIITTLSDKIAELFQTSGITRIYGHGRLLHKKRVEVTQPEHRDNPMILSAENIVLAAGSSPMHLAAAPLDGDAIVDSTKALEFDSVPKKLGIIGAGVIGFELSGIWSHLGSKVVMLEAQYDFLSVADKQISKEAFRHYTEQGMDIRLGARVTNAKKSTRKVIVEYEDADGKHNLRLDKLIVSVGRKPNSDSLFAPEVDLLLDERGFVHVDEQCMTNIPGIYAIGDLALLGPLLAHKGLEEGVFVAEHIAGRQISINYKNIPSVIYTDPEIAWVGQTEQALRAMGEKIKIGVFPFSASARAHAVGKTTGLVKIISSTETDKILGVHIIGANASELIAEAVVAMEFSAAAEDLARTIHAHPTMAEAMREAALAVDKHALHFPPKK
ncbi:MAG: dihydrolipoyl dehydrogenase [Pseudomonadota bacterium]